MGARPAARLRCLLEKVHKSLRVVVRTHLHQRDVGDRWGCDGVILQAKQAPDVPDLSFLHSSDSSLFQVSPARKQRTVTASSAIWILTHLALLTSRHLLVISPVYFNKYPCFVHLPLCLLACVVTLIIRRL